MPVNVMNHISSLVMFLHNNIGIVPNQIKSSEGQILITRRCSACDEPDNVPLCEIHLVTKILLKFYIGIATNHIIKWWPRFWSQSDEVGRWSPCDEPNNVPLCEIHLVTIVLTHPYYPSSQKYPYPYYPYYPTCCLFSFHSFSTQSPVSLDTRLGNSSSASFCPVAQFTQIDQQILVNEAHLKHLRNLQPHPSLPSHQVTKNWWRFAPLHFIYGKRRHSWNNGKLLLYILAFVLWFKSYWIKSGFFFLPSSHVWENRRGKYPTID